VIVGLLFLARPIVFFGEQQRYQDRIIYEEQTPSQKIVLTEWKGYHWLYLNNNEQFSSYDEYRYHEPLVHPAMHASVARRNILILGGGDGLAAREVLKYPEVEEITIVDIDERVVELCKTHPAIASLNQGALEHEKVRTRFKDAYIFMENAADLYDVIIIDLPDPKTADLARLYSKEFYMLCKKRLSKGGAIVTQATSPHFAREAFLCINKTLEESGFSTLALQNHVPTMGQWGWVMGLNVDGLKDDRLKEELLTLEFKSIETRFLNQNAMAGMLSFGKDMYEDFDSITPSNHNNLKVFWYYKNKAWEIY
jgi:spermidine synthase